MCANKVKDGIPHELRTVRSAMVQGGLFQVFANGDIYKVTKTGKKKKAVISVAGKRNKYLKVSHCIDGKQKSYYVHRLLLEGFLPDYNEKNYVWFEDGNSLNCDLHNLTMLSPNEHGLRCREVAEDALERLKVPCKMCGKGTRTKNNVCLDCKRELRVKDWQERAAQDRKDTVKGVELKYLTARQKEVVLLRREGKTYEEISSIVGVSKQGVASALEYAKARADKKAKQLAELDELVSSLKGIDMTTLTVKQRELVMLLQEGKTVIEISEMLGVSVSHLKSRLTKILKYQDKGMFDISSINISMLTRKQKEIVLLMREGKNVEEVSEIVGLDVYGVRNMVKAAVKRGNQVDTLDVNSLNLRRLPMAQREVVEYLQEGKSIEDIAGILGVNVTTVYLRLSRALKKHNKVA